ncbi:hypothetical protein FA13DRAFT_1718177 [Coprinellus micaceus]|uniref:Uncharacterized protein n=1 Tax=Coprinellus micaceus TaxID=71717 RepID=A0A4Y7SE70_COPMI|nr:hypothetical protein FA13DRAFT_1718177 [Coprinellus micaceus]
MSGIGLVHRGEYTPEPSHTYMKISQRNKVAKSVHGGYDAYGRGLTTIHAKSTGSEEEGKVGKTSLSKESWVADTEGGLPYWRLESMSAKSGGEFLRFQECFSGWAFFGHDVSPLRKEVDNLLQRFPLWPVWVQLKAIPAQTVDLGDGEQTPSVPGHGCTGRALNCSKHPVSLWDLYIGQSVPANCFYSP